MKAKHKFAEMLYTSCALENSTRYSGGERRKKPRKSTTRKKNKPARLSRVYGTRRRISKPTHEPWEPTKKKHNDFLLANEKGSARGQRGPKEMKVWGRETSGSKRGDQDKRAREVLEPRGHQTAKVSNDFDRQGQGKRNFPAGW